MARDAIRTTAPRSQRETLGGAERAASTVVGGLLAWVGAHRGGVLGAALVALGAYGLHRGLTGRRHPGRRRVARSALEPTASDARAVPSTPVETGRELAPTSSPARHASRSPSSSGGRPNGHGPGTVARSRGEPS